MDKWKKEANFLLEKCKPNSNFAVGFRMGYIEGCKERVKEREELKNHLKECPKHPLREVEIKVTQCFGRRGASRFDVALSDLPHKGGENKSGGSSRRKTEEEEWEFF